MDDIMIGWQEGQQQGQQQSSNSETTSTGPEAAIQNIRQNTTSSNSASSTNATTTTPENVAISVVSPTSGRASQLKFDDRLTNASKSITSTTTTITSTTSTSSRQIQSNMTANFNNTNTNNNNNNDSTNSSKNSSVDDPDEDQAESQRKSPKSSFGITKSNNNKSAEFLPSTNIEENNIKMNNPPLSSDDCAKVDFSPPSSPDNDRALMIVNEDNADQIDLNSDSRSPSSSSVAPYPSTNPMNDQAKTAIKPLHTASSSSPDLKHESSIEEDGDPGFQSNFENLSSTDNYIANILTASKRTTEESIVAKSDLKVVSEDLSSSSKSTIALVSSHNLKNQQALDPGTNGSIHTASTGITTPTTAAISDNGASNSIVASNNDGEPSTAIDRGNNETYAESLKWTPGVPDCDLMMYLRAARSMAAFAGMCDGGNSTDDRNPATRDDTTINALELLHECNYDTSKALQALVRNPIPKGIDKKWSDDEQRRFSRGLKNDRIGKNFFKIRNELLPHKKVSELVEFYYLFKKNPLFSLSKNNRRRRPAPSKLKPTKNLINRENNLEAGDCASSDESGDGSNDNEEAAKKGQNHDTQCLQENTLNSPTSGDQLMETSVELDEDDNTSVPPSTNNSSSNKMTKFKPEPRSPSIMQKSQKLEDNSVNQDHNVNINSESISKVESSIKNEPGTSFPIKLNKPIKEESSLTTESTNLDEIPRFSPQRSSLPEERLPKPSMYMSQPFNASTRSPIRDDIDHEPHALDRGSPKIPSKPVNQSTIQTGCSTLAQFTDSIGQPSPTSQRTPPNVSKHASIPPAQTSCASLAQLTERIGQPSPNSSNSANARPSSQTLPPNLNSALSQIPGLPGLPPNLPYGLPYWNYGQPPRPGQPPMPLPNLFPGMPGFPGFPPLNTLNPTSSSPAKLTTPKGGPGTSSQARSSNNTASQAGGLHNQSVAPIPSPHQQTSANLASPSAHPNSSPNKIRTQNAILTRVIQRPDNITCARTDWTFKPQKTDAEWYRRCQKKRSERDHPEPKKPTLDREAHHTSHQHQSHSHTQHQTQSQLHQQPLNLPSVPQQTMPNFMTQHQVQPRDREPQGLPPGPTMPGLTDPSHLLHPFPGTGLDRQQSSRYLDNPPLGPFGFRNTPGDLTRPHTAFSPAGFPPRATPTSLPSTTPGLFQGPGFPPIPAALEAIFMQYHHLYNERLANANANALDLESRRLFQHPGYPDTSTGGPPGSGPGGLPPPLLHNPGSPNPAALAGLIFPPSSDARDQFSDRLSQPDAFRLPLRSNPDLYQAYAAAISHLGGAHEPPGGPGGQSSGPGGPGSLGLPFPPPHSQADSLSFPGGPSVRPMMPGRDQYFNPQRYASYGSPYGVPPSPFFGLGGPPAP